jgi:hypothetical protein
MTFNKNMPGEFTMTILLEDLSGGLSPDHELFFAERPTNPEMRESTSIWLFDDQGEFGISRTGIEAEAHKWDNDRHFHANFGFRDGSLFVADQTGAAALSPIGADGRPTRFGAGPLRFELIEPFRKWAVHFDGLAAEGTSAQELDGTFDKSRQVPVRFAAELTMVTPGWVQDHTPEKVAAMSETDADDARSMGIGWRIEHLFRATGTLSVNGRARDFSATGSRIKRQSVRPLGGFRGHVWQSALFPDGRAFGYIAYPPGKDGRTYNDGYIIQDGRRYPARATRIPWLRGLVAQGDDATLELESELGTTSIAGRTYFTHHDFHNMELAGGRFNLQQTGAHYAWGDQSAYGMMERSSMDAALQSEGGKSTV